MKRETWILAAHRSAAKAARGDDDAVVTLDGLGALSIVEHFASDAIVASVGLFEAARLPGVSRNAWGRPLRLLRESEAEGVFATAAGFALGGQRATVFVDGAELAGARGELESIAARHLALVAYVATRTTGRGSGVGHEAVAAARDAGWVILVACNLQEAIDLGLVARRIAETVLMPVMVVVDGDPIMRGLQSAALPTADRIRAWLGDPDQRVVSSTPAQRMLFGERRRPVPRWLDLDRPTLIGARLDGLAALHAAAGQRPFFASFIEDRLIATVEDWQHRAGRTCGPLVEYALSDATVVVVAQGAAVETAIAMAQRVRQTTRRKIGVLGIRWLRPLPGARISELLRGKRVVWVLDRMDAPTSAEPPLMAEIRSVAQRAIEVGHFGKAAHPGYRAWSPKDQPRFGSVLCGLGGGVTAADLSALAELEPPTRARPLVLGVDFGSRPSAFPKRQALLDAVRRDHPALTERGVKASGPVQRVTPDGAVSVAIINAPAGVVETTAAVVQVATRGSVRGRMHEGVGIVTLDPETRDALADPGDRFDVDLVAFAGDERVLPPEISVVAGGAIAVEGPVDPAELARTLPAPLALRLGSGDLRLYVTDAEPGESASHRAMRFVGCCMRGMTELSQVDLGFQRVAKALRPVLRGLSEDAESDLLDGVHQGFEQSERVEPDDALPPVSTGDRMAPMAVRHLREREGYGSGGVDSLARFWGETGVLYAQGEVDELTAEPFLTSGVVPALSSTFSDRSNRRSTLPGFEPAACTGCGDCWTVCPEAALGPVALSAAAALEGGVTIVSQRGGDAESLRMLVSKIDKRAGKTMKALETPPTTLGAWLDEPVNALAEKLPADRVAPVREAYAEVARAIGELPVARTAPFFDDREAGSGEVLAIVVNPDACKGCGICIATCEPEALIALPSTPEASTTARKHWHIWEQLPDTSGQTIAHAAKRDDVGPLAASMLSKSCLLALAGGDDTEPGSGARIVLRQVLSAVEGHQQRRWQSFVADLGGLREALETKLRGTLADALPTEDLEALSRGLERGAESTLGIAELTARVPREAEARGVDVEQTRRIVTAARTMATLADRIAAGPQGLGRSRYSVVVTPDAAPGLGNFPFNPFRAPVVIEPASRAVAMARGVLEAHVGTVLRDLAAVRLARLELDSPRAAALAEARLEGLTWEQLTPEERALCPPLILMGTDEAFSDRRLAHLFEARLPVKVLVVADPGASLAAVEPDVEGAKLGSHLGAVATTLVRADVFVAQCSLAHGAHLSDVLDRALRWDGPALIRVAAPSPRRDGMATDATVHLARAAVRGRVAPLFVYDPAADGVFGTRFSLEGNPASGDALVSGASPAHWAAAQGRFASHLSPLAQGEQAMAIEQWLTAEPESRAGTPSLTDEAGRQLAVSPALVEASLGWLAAWRILQELAGEVTPFTEAVRQQVEQQVADARAEEVAAVRAEYERRLAAQESVFQADALERLKQRLMVLAGHRPS